MEIQMLSERGVNIHIYPIIQKRGRVFEGDYIKKDTTGRTVFKATEDSRWNLRCYKFMDYVASRLRKSFDEIIFKENPSMGIIKKPTDDRLVDFVLVSRPDLIYKVIEAVNNQKPQNKNLWGPYSSSPKISIKKAAKDLNWTKGDVINIIKIISNYKFKTEWKILTVKIYNNTVKKNYNSFYTNMADDFESIFNIKFSDDNSECNLIFNTGFGICFLHNIFTGGYQLIDNVLYNLSESSQLIYRKRFLVFNPLPKARLSFDYVCDFLNLDSKNITSKKNIFEKIINELIEKTEIKLIDKNSNSCYTFSKGIKKKDSKVVNLDTYSPDRIKEFLG